MRSNGSRVQGKFEEKKILHNKFSSMCTLKQRKFFSRPPSITYAAFVWLIPQNMQVQCFNKFAVVFVVLLALYPI